MGKFDHLFSVGYCDVDGLLIALSGVVGTKVEQSHLVSLDAKCESYKNLHYFNALGEEELEGADCRRSEWMFFMSDFQAMGSMKPVWLAYYKYTGIANRSWTWVAAADLTNLKRAVKAIGRGTSTKELTTNELFNKIFAELEVYQNTAIGDVIKYTEVAQSRVSRLTNSINGSNKRTATRSSTKATSTRKTGTTTTKKSTTKSTSAKANEVSVEEVKETEVVKNPVVETAVESNEAVREPEVQKATYKPSKDVGLAEQMDVAGLIRWTSLGENICQAAKDIADNFAIKDSYLKDKRATSIYLWALSSRIIAELEKGRDLKDEGFVCFNKDRSRILFSTGLPNIFGNIIHIVAKIDMTKKKMSSYVVPVSRSQLKDYDFDIGVKLNLPRIELIPASEMVFHDDIECIDLEDDSRFVHCLHERKDRLTEELRGMSFTACCKDMMEMVETAIKLNSFDSSFMKPIYTVKTNDVSFCFPYYVGGDMDKKPELGIILSKIDGYWKIATILPLNWLYSNVIVTQPLTKCWDNLLINGIFD